MGNTVDRIYGGVASLIVRHAKAVLVTMVILCVISLGLSFSIPTPSESDQYLDKSTPPGIVYDQYTQRFNQDTYFLFIQSSSPSDIALLKRLDILGKEIERLNHIDRVISIATVISEENGGMLPDNQEEVDEIVSRLPPDTIAQLLPGGQATIAYVILDQGVSSDTSENVVPLVQDTVDAAVIPPGVTIELTGNTPYDIQIENASMDSFSVLLMGSMVLMLIVLMLLFSNMRFWGLPIILLTFGMIYTFGVMGIAGIGAGDGAITAFPILLGLGIDYAVQFHSRFDEERRSRNETDALAVTLKNTGPAVLSAMAATSMGFIAMFITPVPMIANFGITAIIGVVCCYLTAVFGFGAFAVLFKYSPKEQTGGITERIMKRYSSLLSSIAGNITRIAVPVLIVSVLIAGIGISADSGIVIDTSAKSMSPPNLPAQLVFDKVEDVVGGMTPCPLYIRGGDQTSLVTVLWIDQFGNYLTRTHTEIQSVDSIATLVRAANDGQIPSDQEGLDQVLASIPYDQKIQYLQGPDTGALIVNMVALNVNQQLALMDAIDEDITWADPPPGIELTVTGDFYLYSELIVQIEENKDRMTIFAFILIFIFLIVIYRRLIATTPLIPLICVVGWNPVAMILMGQDYNLMTALLGSMTIGIGSEYTILVMERYLEERKSNPDVVGSIQAAVQKIGAAVSVSGLVTASGFSALLLSPFPFLSTFGLSTVIAVVFSLVGAIMIMPAALTLATMTKSVPLKE